MACAPSHDSDQPGHQPSLIRVFAVRMKKARVLIYLLSAQQRWRKLGSLSTHWAHSEDSDQTGRKLRLIRVFAGCKVRDGSLMRKNWATEITAVFILKFEQLSFTISNVPKRCRKNDKQWSLKEQSDLGYHCLPRRICPNARDFIVHIFIFASWLIWFVKLRF